MDLSRFNNSLDPTINATSPSLTNFKQPVDQEKSKKLEKVKKRVFEHVKYICSGASQITSNSSSRRLNEEYWLREVICRDLSYSSNICSLLRSLWRKNETLSFPEFVSEKETEYLASARKNSNPLKFHDWLALEFMSETEKETWRQHCEENPQEKIPFSKWKEEQLATISEFGVPLWALKESYREYQVSMCNLQNQLTFVEWLPTFKRSCIESSKRLETNFGHIMSPNDFAAEQLCHSFRQSCLDVFYQIIQTKKEHSDSKEDLESYAMRLYYNLNPKNSDLFEVWREQKDTALQNQHKNSNSPLSFDEWKKIQVKNPFNESSSLTRCSPEQRVHFLTNVKDGILLRNGHPFNTEFELVEGKKRSIFVIGPDQKLYCASKVRDVFQHSSFFNGGIVCAAGSLKTDEQGRLTHLFNYSGHYRSSRKSDLFMLEFFRQHGVDLSTVLFFTFENHQDLIAQEYLDQLYRS